MTRSRANAPPRAPTIRATLVRLAELELIDRERRKVERRIKAARFPTVKRELALQAQQPFFIARLDQLVHEGGGRREADRQAFLAGISAACCIWATPAGQRSQPRSGTYRRRLNGSRLSS
jgi:hypothetical protein